LVEACEELLVGLDTVTGLEDLVWLFEQQGSHLPFGQTAAQIEERAVWVAGSAVTSGPAASEEALQKGGVKGIVGKGEGAQEMGFAPTQGEGGEVLEVVLTHIMSKIAQSRPDASENESAG
jgi:hypothetical protein